MLIHPLNMVVRNIIFSIIWSPPKKYVCFLILIKLLINSSVSFKIIWGWWEYVPWCIILVLVYPSNANIFWQRRLRLPGQGFGFRLIKYHNLSEINLIISITTLFLLLNGIWLFCFQQCHLKTNFNRVWPPSTNYNKCWPLGQIIVRISSTCLSTFKIYRTCKITK